MTDSCDLAAGAVDCNGNGFLDSCEIALGTGQDCNGNGVLDSCELASGVAQDCNGNGVLDSCELAAGTATDCDGNGVLDACDIAAGAADCNANGVLDTCELAGGAEQDCNGNGILDSCELAGGAESDCNGNGVLDSCELLADPTLDLNQNGTPDRCERIGNSYCSDAIPNSTGEYGELTVLGSFNISQNDMTLSARRLPPQSFGFFITSQAPANIYPLNTSEGRLCVTGQVGRYVGPGQLVNSGPSGSVGLPIDLTAMPTPTGFIPATFFSTWYFQLWHRDAVGGQTTSNFTDAVAVTFQ
ncbi:hypothetical protein N9151_00095 [bacterium]|nr:hypothetical protein [bacterium]